MNWLATIVMGSKVKATELDRRHFKNVFLNWFGCVVGGFAIFGKMRSKSWGHDQTKKSTVETKSYDSCFHYQYTDVMQNSNY